MVLPPLIEMMGIKDEWDGKVNLNLDKMPMRPKTSGDGESASPHQSPRERGLVTKWEEEGEGIEWLFIAPNISSDSSLHGLHGPGQGEDEWICLSIKYHYPELWEE